MEVVNKLKEGNVIGDKRKIEEFYFEKNKDKIIRILCNALNTKHYKEILMSIGLGTIEKIKGIRYIDFCEIPIMSKEVLNRQKYNMIVDCKKKIDLEVYNNLEYKYKRGYLEKKGLELRVTSGSTSEPIEVLKSKEDIKRDYMVLNWYRRKISHYDFKGNFLWIWPVNPLTRKYFYPDDSGQTWWKVNKYGMQYMLYEHSDNNFYEIYNYLIDNNVEWITSSPTTLVDLANYITKTGKIIKSIKYVECHSEYLYDWQKQIITQIFGCQPISVYSSNEVQFMALTCCNGKMHLMDNACFLELIDNNVGGKSVVVTSLNYYDIPIIRYRLGDCAEWEERCSCELKKPTIMLKKYRENDYVVLKNGQRIEPFVISDSIVILYNTFGITISKYKVEQTEIDKFIYFFEQKLRGDYLEQWDKELEEYLSQLFGYVIKVKIQFVDFICFTYSGNKFKYFEVNKELKNSIAIRDR